ncbi:uncharacterized protein A4U43_C01F18940 [Asparagus officinalis]|uniref:Uncharacterized protein n=1 Tax=Asparagus officinalis TaxID=4686 RepID=A0A5P1FQQ2_ASPOF|nr:uncharacterized protein A4U43_C01F18940 [Asparagus officinalis]
MTFSGCGGHGGLDCRVAEGGTDGVVLGVVSGRIWRRGCSTGRGGGWVEQGGRRSERVPSGGSARAWWFQRGCQVAHDGGCWEPRPCGWLVRLLSLTTRGWKERLGGRRAWRRGGQRADGGLSWGRSSEGRARRSAGGTRGAGQGRAGRTSRRLAGGGSQGVFGWLVFGALRAGTGDVAAAGLAIEARGSAGR